MRNTESSKHASTSNDLMTCWTDLTIYIFFFTSCTLPSHCSVVGIRGHSTYLVFDKLQLKRSGVLCHTIIPPPCGNEVATCSYCRQDGNVFSGQIVLNGSDWTEQNLLSFSTLEVLERKDGKLTKALIRKGWVSCFGHKTRHGGEGARGLHFSILDPI